jgi:amino acid permease
MKKIYEWYRELLLPAGLLAAVIIGAGMFALPYAFMKAGFGLGLLYLFLFASVFAFIHVLYGKIIKRTEGRHRFVGYAKIHLGEKGFFISVVTTLCGTFLSLTAYLVLSKSFIELIVPAAASGHVFLLFWVTSTIAIILGIRRLAAFEFGVVFAMLVIMLVIFGFGITTSDFSLSALPVYDPIFFFLPFGSILFALNGRAAISSIQEYFEAEKINGRRFYAAMVLGTFLPAVFYFLFSLGVVGLSPYGVTNDAISGIQALSPLVLSGIGLLGIFSLWTSYVLLGLEVRDILAYDFKLSKAVDAIAATCIPLALYVLGFKDFMELISFSGGVFLAIEAILIMFMWQRISGKPVVWQKTLILIFVIGAMYEIFVWVGRWFPFGG